MIKAIVFDIGGVLIQDPWEWMLLNSPDNIADKFNLSREEVLEVGSALWKKYDRISRPQVTLLDQEKEWWSFFLESFSEKKDNLTAEYLLQETDKYLRPIEPVQTVQILDFLKNKNLKLGICSNNTDFWFAREWTKLGYESYFPEQNIILSQRIGHTKSSPEHEMFKAIKYELNCEFEQIIFIDDRLHNLKSASECGIVGLHMSGQSKDDVEQLYNTLRDKI